MPNVQPKLSVIITNYNYGRFVSTAIESLLSQSIRPEIIVVDDCSTDNSRDIISSYSQSVEYVFQSENKGHGGGFNAGFARATGDLVMFLDADDFLLPGAIETILGNYHPDIVMYHYRMRYADEAGELSGIYPPLQKPLAEGDISLLLRTLGDYHGTITSGLVFSKTALDSVMPMDAEQFRQGADGYLSATVPLYGLCTAYDETISAYRLHGLQHSQFAKVYAKRARWRMAHKQDRYDATSYHSQKLGLEIAPDLNQRDASYVLERLVSILFEPDLHPVANDTVSAATRVSRRLCVAGKSGFHQLLEQSWWMCFSVAPLPLKRTLMSWKIDASARPVWLHSTGRFVRHRLLNRSS